VQERAAVLELRRGIHHDERANPLCDALYIRLLATVGLPTVCLMILKRDPEVAAEAGVRRSGGKRKLFMGEQAVQPFGKLLLALHIGLWHGLNVKLA